MINGLIIIEKNLFFPQAENTANRDFVWFLKSIVKSKLKINLAD